MKAWRWGLCVAVVALAGACGAGRRVAVAPQRVQPDSLSVAIALREQGRHEAAARELERVIGSDASPWLRAEAQWELYVTHRERGSARDALQALVACAAEGAPSPWVAQQVRARIGPAVASALHAGVGWDRVSTMLAPLEGSPLLLEVASSLLEAGHCRAASATLSRVGGIDDHGRAAQLRELLRRAARCLERTGRSLGLVVPLSGEYAEYGTSLLRGVTLAIEDTTVLALRPVDSRSDPVEAVRAVQRLASSPDVVAAIGPLQSRAATGAALAAVHGELPLLVPLTAPSRLNQLGPWVFQSSVPLQAEARAAARWAMVHGGFSRFAVFYPAHVAGERAMDAFRTQVLGLGGEVVALERYVEGRDTNFRDQIVNLKRAAPQAVFIPGEPRELVQILRQMAFYELTCQILGTGAWGTPEVIGQGGRLVEGVVFADVEARERPARLTDAFFARYHDRWGGDPDHYASIGYDLGTLVWEAVSQGASSRDELRRRLAERPAWHGVSGVINWHDDATSADVRLYTVSGGIAVPLQTGTK